jgi:hypothetical protein
MDTGMDRAVTTPRPTIKYSNAQTNAYVRVPDPESEGVAQSSPTLLKAYNGRHTPIAS